MKQQRLLVALLVCGGAFASCAADVTANWEEHCASCHGTDGRGETKMGKKLKIGNMTDPAYQAKFTDEQAAKAIKDGVKDEKGKSRMKPVEGLSDDDIQALVARVRSLKQ